MSRCDCETACYRVFCGGLLIIAFTFTVILTNVFLDIDSLLTRKEREPSENLKESDQGTDGYETTTEIQEYYIGVEKNDDIEGTYRTKRSLGSGNIFLHINNPKTKRYLTNRLAALLETLDDEDPETTTPKKTDGNIYIKTVKQKNNIEINELRPDTIKEEEKGTKDEDMLHLAMHNILLQGVVGRMDMSEVYKNLQALVRKFKYGGENEKDIEPIGRLDGFYSETTTERKITLNEEQNMIEELLKYKMADQDRDLSDDLDTYNEDEIKNNKKRMDRRRKIPKYLIKTLIDIKKDENMDSKENLQGIIKLIYNGKPINIREISDETTKIKATTAKTTTTKSKQKTETRHTTETTRNTINRDVEEFASILKDNFKKKNMPDSYLKTVMLEYLKKFSTANYSSVNMAEKISRTKRNTDSNEKQMELPQAKDEDELFVEIKTHFDKKGLNGDKRRIIVSNLIKKIQNAIISKPENKQVDDLRIIKRVQNPLDHGNVPNYILNTVIPPISRIYREMDPISQSKLVLEPHIAVNYGENCKNCHGPKFLSSSKSINSAEISLVDVDYNKNNENLNIPTRLQVPLVTDTSGETVATIDVGKQLLIKDLIGTGFSIGYNQYVDQAPDPESIKLFQGIENIINKYHQKHDKPDQDGNQDEYEIYGQVIKKRDVRDTEAPLRTKRFVVLHNVRRSVNKVNGYHTNSFKYIYNDKYRSYNTQEEVYDVHERKPNDKINSFQDVNSNKNIDPSHFNGDRLKRSIKHKKIVNLNTKIKVSKYLNTRTIPRQRRDFIINKRNKRHVDNMQLILKPAQISDNNNMFIVSNADMYNDTLIVRHRQSPEFFFRVVDKAKWSNRNPYFNNKRLFKSSNQPLNQYSFQINNSDIYEKKALINDNVPIYFGEKLEKKERYKRQVHRIKVIARGMVNKESNEKTFAEYDNMYSDKSVITQIDEPQIIVSDDEASNNEHDNESVVNDNLYMTDDNNPTLGRNQHVFDFSPLAAQLRENPLMSKYPHIFVEDRTSGERPETHIHRTIFTKPESKESDTSSDYEALSGTPNLKDLVNAVIPSHRNGYKVSVKLIPHGNDTKTGFKEIHASINKTFNKNGVLYSSLVNVSEISKIELDNNTNANTTHLFSHRPTTVPNIIETMKPRPIERGFASIYMTKKQLAEYNKERDEIINIIKKGHSTTTPEASVQNNLMDVVLPFNPPKVLHLTVADISKLLCNAMKTQDSEISTTTIKMTTTTDQITNTPKTTMMTTAKTIKPEKRTLNTQTVDPLKIKLLKAMSLNEQLTSQILEKIDQNTGVLKTFLTKISSEIAKLPSIATQAMEKNKKYPDENIHPIYSNPYSTNATGTAPLIYTIAQAGPPEYTNTVTIPNQSPIQVSPLVKNLRINDRMAELRVNVNDSDDNQRDQTRYFIDDYLNKSSLPQIIGGTKPRNIISTQGLEEKTSKQNIDIALKNDDPSQSLNDIGRINSVNSNAIVQNNTLFNIT